MYSNSSNISNIFIILNILMNIMVILTKSYSIFPRFDFRRKFHNFWKMIFINNLHNEYIWIQKRNNIARGRFEADWNDKNVNESISDICCKILLFWKYWFFLKKSLAYFIILAGMYIWMWLKKKFHVDIKWHEDNSKTSKCHYLILLSCWAITLLHFFEIALSI